MSRSICSRLLVCAATVLAGFTWLAVNGRADDDDRNEVHGCITAVTLDKGSTTTGTVKFEGRKGSTTVKVGTATSIKVCGKTKTLAELKTLVEAVKTGEHKYCGSARVDNLTSLNAVSIRVCNRGDDDDDDEGPEVHGCISTVTLDKGSTTTGTVKFDSRSGSTTVKVGATTVIKVCGKTKTLEELKTLVEAVKTGERKYCGNARVDNRTSLNALSIRVCNRGDDDDDEDNGKKVGQANIVHGCITAVTLDKGSTTAGTVKFEHPKFGGTVKVGATTVIKVCEKTKTLTELKTLVEAVKTGQPKYCGIARIDNRTNLNASRIHVCNDDADDDD